MSEIMSGGAAPAQPKAPQRRRRRLADERSLRASVPRHLAALDREMKRRLRAGESLEHLETFDPGFAPG